jgi:hypothetical protein
MTMQQVCLVLVSEDSKLKDTCELLWGAAAASVEGGSTF